ncbi:PAAR domain-containing protein [Cesiribacter sp. SM1]|uniref:PAAR domain-containing protein n=1 Tax=Cesiribacter sp. SM1 TaxID=2861196 RepID=UPI00351D2DFA
MSKPAARIGDMHMCPMVTPGLPPVPHVGGPITGPGCPTVLIGGMPAAVMGDMCTCVGPPDTIVLGSTGVFIGGKPAARMGDQCVHGGAITLGCPTVLIGETGGGGGGGAATKKGSGGGGSSSSSAAKSGGLAAMPVEALKNVIRDAPPDVAKKLAQVVTLKEATIDGTPFCKICSKS